MTDVALSAEDELRTAILLEAMEKRPTGTCIKCRAAMSAHEVVIAHAMGFKDRFTCPACISDALGKERPQFLEHVLRHIEHRPCFLQAWKWASRFHGLGETLRPPKLFPEDSSSHREDVVSPPEAAIPHVPAPESVPETGRPHELWDAGDMGCGDLVLELRMRLLQMSAGQLLEVRATDPGAPEDIPAWCSMTGHGLVTSSHPLYLIRRRERP